jgi:hypothetical protein
MVALALFIMRPATAWSGDRISDTSNSFSLELPNGWAATQIEAHRIFVLGDGFPGKFGVTVRFYSTPEQKNLMALTLAGLNLNSDAILSNGRHLSYLVQFGAPTASSPNGSITIFGKMEAGDKFFSFQSSSFRPTKPDADASTKPLLDAVKQIAASLRW